MWGANRHSTPSPVNNTNDLRNRQITAVLQRFPEAKPVAPDRSVIDVPLMLPSGTRLSFRLQLPPSFPSQPPVLRLLGRASHPSLDHTGTVRHPRLQQQWGSHLNLADAVGDVLNMFYTSPPRTAPSPAGGFSPSPSQHSQQSPSQSPSPSSRASSTSPSSLAPPQVPSIPSSFAELEAKSLDELRALANDTEAFDSFVSSLSWTAEVHRLADQLSSRSTQLAESNLRDGEQVREVQERVAQLRQEVEDLRPEVADLEQRQQRVMHQYSRDALMARLQEKIAESEAFTDRMSGEFTSPGASRAATDFIQEYREQRFLYHMRRLKKERFESAATHHGSGAPPPRAF